MFLVEKPWSLQTRNNQSCWKPRISCRFSKFAIFDVFIKFSPPHIRAGLHMAHDQITWPESPRSIGKLHLYPTFLIQTLKYFAHMALWDILICFVPKHEHTCLNGTFDQVFGFLFAIISSEADQQFCIRFRVIQNQFLHLSNLFHITILRVDEGIFLEVWGMEFAHVDDRNLLRKLNFSLLTIHLEHLSKTAATNGLILFHPIDIGSFLHWKNATKSKPSPILGGEAINIEKEMHETMYNLQATFNLLSGRWKFEPPTPPSQSLSLSLSLCQMHGACYSSCIPTCIVQLFVATLAPTNTGLEFSLVGKKKARGYNRALQYTGNCQGENLHE